MGNPANSVQSAMERVSRWAERTAENNRIPDVVTLADGTTAAVIEIGPLEFMHDREIWERQPGESDKEWEMFVHYRDQPSWSRTKRAVGVHFGLARGNGTPPAITSPATVNRWDERVRAYDAHCDGRMREELFQRRLKARIETAQIGRQMRVKAALALRELRAVIYVYRKDPETGETVRETRSALKPGDIARLAEIGVKLERLALGEEDRDGALQTGATFNMTQINIGSMDDEELIKRATEIITTRPGDIIHTGPE